MTRLHLVVVVLACGCAGDASEAMSGDESSSTSTGDSATVTASITDPTVTTMSATDPSDSMTDATATTPTTADSSGSATETSTTDTGATDSTTDGETTDGSTSDTTGEGSTTESTGGGAGSYPPCDFDQPMGSECAEGEECLDFDDEGVNWCSAGCFSADDCPPADGGEAVLDCTFGRCGLDCTGDLACPGGMACTEIFGVFRCAWPS